MNNNNYNTDSFDCQEKRILKKIQIKKSQNDLAIDYLHSIRQDERADRIHECATWVGITDIGGIAHIVKSNFCRERLCAVCAWRRQAKFVAQMRPVMQYLSDKYNFIFVTLTVKNMPFDDLSDAVDNILYAYYKLTKRRKFKRAWHGVCRSLELTYNSAANTYHPHLHLLVAVDENYYRDDNYITLSYLINAWRDCLGVDYNPNVDIRAVDDDETENATVETLKYALKPTREVAALKAFFEVMSGRRLVSFTGVFAKARRMFKLSDFETQLNDDVKPDNVRRTFNLYKFDVTGGVYTYYKKLYLD